MFALLSVTRETIPYIKGLRAITGSVTGCILMQQLDYWFEKYPDGFFKFLEPAKNNSFYRKGDSWEEELGFSKDEFRTAFDKIGVRYASRTQFQQAEGDPFNGKLYLSYLDKLKGTTHYLRNHEVADEKLRDLVEKRDLRGSKDPISVDRESQSPGIGNPNLRGSEMPIPISISENTTKTKTENTTEEERRSKIEPCREETPARDFVHPVRDFDRKMSEPLPPWRTSKGPNGIKPEFVTHFQERMKSWGKDSNPSIANAKSAIMGMERSQDESKRDRLQLDWEDFVERSSRKEAVSQQQSFEEQRHQECLALIESLQCWIKAGKILRIEYLKGQSVYAVLANSKNGERTHERHLKWEVEQWRNELVCA